MVAVPKPQVPAVDLASPAAATAALRTFWKLAETWELSAAEQATLLGVGRTTLYRARVIGLSHRNAAEQACDRMRSRGACMIVAPGA